MAEQYLTLNGNKFYYDEIADYSFRNSIPLNGYESKTLEFCRSWLNGVQEFPIQTSGSTGVPKTIILTRKQLETSARRTVKTLNLKAGDCTFICLNTEYIAGMMMLVRGFLANLQIIIVEPISNPLTLVSPEENIAFASFVPMQLHAILSETPERLEQLNSMKGILVGGAPLTPTQERELQQVSAPIFHTYGMTETASHIALRKLNGPDAAAYYNVLDDITVGLDKRGCLTIKGDITNNELLVTNDIVELLTPTRFRWLGRADNTINTGGVKVQVETVELAISKAMIGMENPPRFFIAPQPDEVLGDKIVLLVEGAPLPPAQEQELFERMRDLLRKFEIPKEVYYAPAFSQTTTGKLSRLKTLQKMGLYTDPTR
ncbi:AMP-binding protein [Pontibacter akesuensis]|uniref:O-succinylbenzoic acid--CoA ligase n=1 Tax=Pontibacter akesuensis TaxID=388950 RepID=A0A1I7GQV3_9BACT|nr:AMP-binding protein [Pontibacter akesuensis]GHA55542.1 O-succinylbenzoic acid--CoA ligase [Pontibacter akesuensis]SFU50817.1 O-succinylbenzoic acid--CoA ligase [Pontibacter akesuensis]